MYQQSDHPNTVFIIYDALCPFCRSYAHLLRLRAAVANVVLIDARTPSALRDEVTAKDIDLDQGMVVKIDNRFYHGADAMHVLALLSTPSGMFNRMIAKLFQSQTHAAAVYPVLRYCRRVMLCVLRIPLILNLTDAAQL